MLNKDSVSKYMIPLSPQPTHLERKGRLDRKMGGILFDIYGTLFISGSGDIGIIRENIHNHPRIKDILNGFGIKKEPADVIEAFFNKISEEHIEMREKGVDFPEVQIDRIWKEILCLEDLESAREFSVRFEMITNPVYPMPNLQKVLKALKDKKIPMGIISNAQFYTPFMFEWFLGKTLDDLEFNSDLVFFSYREGIAKPSLKLFDLALNRLNQMGISAESVLYVGNDMRNDILPALKKGFKTALFAGDERSLRLRHDIEECLEITPDLIVTDLVQLLDFI